MDIKALEAIKSLEPLVYVENIRGAQWPLTFKASWKKNQSKEGLEQSHFVLQFFSFLSICTCFVSFLVRCSSLIPFCFRLFIMLKVMMTIRDAYLLSGYCYFVLKRLLVRVSTVMMPSSAQLCQVQNKKTFA